MVPAAIANWHQFFEQRDMAGLDKLLADDAVMVSPVVHTPQEGKAITKLYLMGASHVIANEHFKYLRETYADNFAVLEFETEVGGKVVNGVDIITWNEQDQITEFKVMLRPLQGLMAVKEEMAAALQRFQSGKA